MCSHIYMKKKSTEQMMRLENEYFLFTYMFAIVWSIVFKSSYEQYNIQAFVSPLLLLLSESIKWRNAHTHTFIYIFTFFETLDKNIRIWLFFSSFSHHSIKINTLSIALEKFRIKEFTRVKFNVVPKT